MPIFFNKTLRGNPLNAAAPKRWYPVLKSTGLVKEQAVAKFLSDETTLNPKEAEMAVYQLLKVVVNLLKEGHTVQLGPLGSFRLTATTQASDTEAEADGTKIKKLNTRFTESPELKNALKKVTFMAVEAMSNK